MADPAQDTALKLQRAKERLYVLCQLGGWGFYFGTQIVLMVAFKDSAGSRDGAITSLVRIVMQGVLLTHGLRFLITRWGWKSLPWGPLVPRVIGLSMVGAAVWCAVGYAFDFGLLGRTAPPQYSLSALIATSWFFSTMMLIAWLWLYFFYQMFERLSRLQLEQVRLAANVKEAELRALKSQVNPHFLFNSLNSLRALIDEDAPRAREAVTRLANMLRYSLQSGQQETVPLEDEIRIVEDYLALETIRHEARLRVQWDIAPEARLVKVPPMLLQTLVENAVKYGISTRREGGEIGIVARIEAGALMLRVTNPGDLNLPASAAAARAGSSTGVGLRNASERLGLLFGERAQLTLRPEPMGCVTAEVTFPLNSAAS